MRIRRKKWAEKELEESEFYIHNPSIYKGKWKSMFKNINNPLHIELGCGKGTFISTLASENKDINYIAIDMIEAMLGLSKRNIENAYKFEKPENLYLIRANVENILDVFDKNDAVQRIYINFCNPWPKKKHNKRRLTHIKQLEKYREILVPEGEIYFKTDSDELFEDTIEYLKLLDYNIKEITYDLHNNQIFEKNIITEHEKMFSENGIKIKALIAKC